MYFSQDTSLPCAIFHWTIKNYGTDDLDVSLMFTFKNGQGDASDAEGNAWSETFSTPASGDGSIQQMAPDDDSIQQVASGVLIHQVIKHMNCTYAVAANQRVIQALFELFNILFLLYIFYNIIYIKYINIMKIMIY